MYKSKIKELLPEEGFVKLHIFDNFSEILEASGRYPDYGSRAPRHKYIAWNSRRYWYGEDFTKCTKRELSDRILSELFIIDNQQKEKPYIVDHHTSTLAQCYNSPFDLKSISKQLKSISSQLEYYKYRGSDFDIDQMLKETSANIGAYLHQAMYQGLVLTDPTKSISFNLMAEHEEDILLNYFNKSKYPIRLNVFRNTSKFTLRELKPYKFHKPILKIFRK